MKTESPEELPALRQAIIGKIFEGGDAVKTIQGIDKDIWRMFFGGTGADTPEKFLEAVRGQVNLQRVVDNPNLRQKFSSAFQQGAKSLGMKAKEAALSEAEDALKRVPDASQMIQDALKGEITPAAAKQQAGMEAMKRPFGGSFQKYVEHRMFFHTALSMAMLGGTYAHAGPLGAHPLAWAIPLAYLGSSKAIGAALSNPRIGKMYYNLLTSKNAEQAGFWMGRLTSASLSESARDSE
jgi:hypothetical protein